MAALPDPFESFVREHELQLNAEELMSAPRDIAAPPAEMERHFVVTLRTAQSNAKPVALVFVLDSPNHALPSQRDVLWWLASDAWAVEKAGHEYSQWLSLYGYADDPSALRIFRLQNRQSQMLAQLLGSPAYDALVRLHDEQVSINGRAD